MSIRHAQCSCGQLRVRVDGEPVRISICHCLACQRRTGSAFGYQARFRREHTRIEGDSSQYRRQGDSGRSITFHFCAHCGATVYYYLEGFDDVIAIPVGGFADPAFAAPRVSVYSAYRHAWVGLPDAIEHQD